MGEAMQRPDAHRRRRMQHPIMVVLKGDAMSADDAAWALIADAAAIALKLPGLTPDGRRLILEAFQSCRLAAGLPPQPHPERLGAADSESPRAC